MAFCINCGQPLLDNVEFCPECGLKITYLDKTQEGTKSLFVESQEAFNKEKFEEIKREEANTEVLSGENGIWRNKWISLGLCIMLGWLGIHRFYEGKVFTGILYLLTFGFFGIGWVIDIIRIARMSNPYKTK